MTTMAVQYEDRDRAGAGTALVKYQVLLGAVLIQLILGTVYGYSIFWEPLSAIVFPDVVTQADYDALVAAGNDVSGLTPVADEAAVETERAVQQGYLKYAFSICILSFAVVMVLAGRVQDVRGPRFTATIGAVLMGGGFLVAGLMNHFIVFYLAHAVFTGVVGIVALMVFHALFGKLDPETNPVVRYVPLGIIAAAVVAGVLLGQQYVGKSGELDKLFMLWGTVGFLAGAGIGFAYVCPIAALIKWFPRHKGLVSGLAVAGFGFGAFLFKDDRFGAAGYIRNHDIVSFFVIHGIVCLVGVTLGAMLLRNPPGTPKTTAGAMPDSNWQDTLRHPTFYMLWLMFFSGAMAGLMVIGILKPFVQNQLLGSGVSAEAAAAAGLTAVGVLAILNATGRIAWGFISDRIGRTGAFAMMFALQAAAMLALGSLDSKTALVVASGVIGFNFGGNFALFPSATADLFGSKNLGANYGWVFTSYGIAGVVGIAAGNAAKASTGSYSAAFAVAAVLCVVSAVLALVLHRSRPAAATA